MTFSSLYLKQVKLLINVIPFINKHQCFALKGGTAINMFYQNMPRLSVDLDLTYLPIQDRNTFIEEFSIKMNELLSDLNAAGYISRAVYLKNESLISKIEVQHFGAQIKIEPNLIIRGSVFKPEIKDLCKKAQETFLTSLQMQTLSISDVYGGKICAALSRQHPRDLFDIKILFETIGITETIRQAFCIYLASSPRPMHEILNPKIHFDNLRAAYRNSFEGMTEDEMSLEELKNQLQNLNSIILKTLTESERQFLLSIKAGEPDWKLLPIFGIENLPALKWKIHNIKLMDKKKHSTMLNALRSILQL